MKIKQGAKSTLNLFNSGSALEFDVFKKAIRYTIDVETIYNFANIQPS